MVTTKSRISPAQYLDVFDEDSVAKAITYRKAKFDEGVNKVQAVASQIESLPTLTKEDGDYLNAKVSNITNQINSVAGLDLSNPMNVNQLASEYTSITNDPTILNAVASARNHQKNMEYLEQAKNNPKKYGDVLRVQNEWDYNKQLNSYKEARAQGKEAVFNYTYKPYRDVESILSKELEKIKANATTTATGNYFIDGEEVTPERIRDFAFNRIKSDPSLSEQIRINSSYSTQGVSDVDLLRAKNISQRLELDNKRQIATKELRRLNSLDMKDVKQLSTQLNNVKQALDVYDKSYKSLLSNPNKVLLDLDTGEENKTFNREQLAYELSANALLKDLTAKHAYSKYKTRVNPIPLKEQELNWDRQMDNLKYQLDVKEFNHKVEQDKIENQYKLLSSSTNGRKFKLDENNNLVSYDVPPSQAIDENPRVTFQSELIDTKQQTRDLLKNTIKDKLNKLATVMPQNWLDRYVDNMMRDNGNVTLDVNKSTAKLKNQMILAGNKSIPEDAIIKEAIRWINQLSVDSKKIWEGDNTLSQENAQVLSQYTDSVQKINALGNIENMALNEAITKAGLTKDAYDRLKSKSNKASKNGYIITARGEVIENANANLSSTLSPKESEALSKVENYVKDYYKNKTQNIKLYPVQNFNPKDDNYYEVKNDVTRYLLDKGLSQEGVGLNSVYGKDNKWSEMLPNADVKVLDYNNKTQTVTVDLESGEGKDKVVLKNQKFRIPKEYMQKHLSKSVIEGSKDLTYTDILRLSNNGNLAVKGRDGKYKDSWKTTPTKIPVQWKASLNNVNDVSDNSCSVYIRIPINGNMMPIEVNLPTTTNPDEAGKQLTNYISTIISQLEPQVQKGTMTPQQMKSVLLNQLMNINNR